jgi:hypothetical protein
MQGELGLFLDDDDLLRPTHLQDLVQALQMQGQAAAAYSGVRVEGPGGQWLRDYNQPWRRERLWGINHLPIHAVLFRRSAVLAASAQFDETLPVLEDWDFWCQLSHQGPFVHVPGIGATYRQGLGTSHLGDAEHANHWAPWHRRILEQHARRWGLEEQSHTLAWHALALDKEQAQHQQTQHQLHESRTQLDQTQAQHQQTQHQLQKAKAQLQQTQVLRQETQAQISNLQASYSLAERSLQLLQQSRAVRAARLLRRLLGRVQ